MSPCCCRSSPVPARCRLLVLEGSLPSCKRTAGAAVDGVDLDASGSVQRIPGGQTIGRTGTADRIDPAGRLRCERASSERHAECDPEAVVIMNRIAHHPYCGMA